MISRPLPSAPPRRGRRTAAVVVAACVLAAPLAPAFGQAAAAPAAASTTAASPAGLAAASPAAALAPSAAPATSAASSFADPAADVRPMYRYWLPLAYVDDDVLRDELRDIAAAGAGGVEIAPFVVPGEGNQSNPFLVQYGWGTPTWAHKMEVVTGEAAELGLSVDQNLGPQYPPTVPTLNSFNQPEAEQQLLFAAEYQAAGASRSGALPQSATAVPSVTTALCEPATAGATRVGVASVGGFAVGDTITIGSGATAEKVSVTALGDRLAICGSLSVSALTQSHVNGEPVVDVARTTRIRTLVAQCAGPCAPGGTGPVSLVPDSVTDVTASVIDGTLAYSFPAGNGNPWVLIDFTQAPSGLIAQRGGYTATQPNFVVDHLGEGGVRIQADFWDENILTDTVQANLYRIGRGAVFEDSLELGTSQKWTWGLLDAFAERRGYDPTLLLPALAGAGIQGTATPAFDFAGRLGEEVRDDYRQTVSDLYVDEYVTPMQAWARSHGLDFRVQAYGTPIATGTASSAAGIPEGESLNFGSPNPLGAEQDYRVVSAGANLAGNDVVSVECCAAFLGGYRSSVAGPNVGGQYGQGGDGTQVGGKYSQGILDSVYKAYAGGVNQLVWHGYPYRDAPKGVGTSGRDGGTWPGYNPWDIFGALNVNDAFGPRQASWEDYHAINDSLARTQLILREGQSRLDLGVYYEDLGLAGSSVSSQQPDQHMLGTDSATSEAGYSYDYVAPSHLLQPGLVPDADGGLFGDSADYDAVILNDQRTMSLPAAERLLELAREGLRVFVVGLTPAEPTGAGDDPAALAAAVTALLAQPSVTRVADEADLPAALATAGIRPTVTPEVTTDALGTVRRDAGDTTYDFVYNRSAAEVAQNLTLSGSGLPYSLDTWTGAITPIAQYTVSADGSQVTVPVRIAPYDKTVIALVDPATANAAGSPWPATASVHAVRSDAAVVGGAEPGTLSLRAESDGAFATELSDGRSLTSTVDGLPAARALDAWSLQAQTWGPGENAYTTVKTDAPSFAVPATDGGGLPAWSELSAPVDLTKASGIGTYTTTIEVGDGWTADDGAYLALGDVLDTAQVQVNGVAVAVNQSDRDRIDLGGALHAGTNTITVRVATTMFNAVRATGDSNYQLPAVQRTGLLGPVSLTPYRTVQLAVAVPTPEPTDPAGTPTPSATPGTGSGADAGGAGNASPASADPRSGDLASTGAVVLPILAVAALLAAAGGFLMVLRRRNSRA